MNQKKQQTLNFISISKDAETAVEIIIELAQVHGNNILQLKDISQKRNKPIRYNKMIASILEENGYIVKLKNSQGYKLKKHPSTISLGEILRLIDGAFTPAQYLNYYLTDTSIIGKNRKMKTFLENIMNSILDIVESTTIEDIAR